MDHLHAPAEPRLSLRLLGPYQVILGDEPAAGFSSTKVRGLLAYLAIESERPHSREALAGLLWPDEPHDVAHANLRQAIANLRQVLGDRTADTPFLIASRGSVHYANRSDSSVDVLQVVQLLALCQGHAHRRSDACPVCAGYMQQAVDLYGGDFLEDLFVNDSAPFEEWALLKRESLRRAVLDALYRLSSYHLRRRDYESARRCAARQLELDPWREEAHRQLMLVLALDGRRSEALAQFERCRRVLVAEFQAEPAPETTELCRQIRSGSLAENTLPTFHNWPTPATSFVGRQREQAQLVERLQMPATRLVTVVGLGGAGKTRLALRVGERLAAEFRDGVGFVSLAGISSAATVSHAIAAALGYVLANRADPTAELSAALHRAELLLILDNCEHQSGQAEVLDQLLRACPGLAVLATAREPLGLAAEWLFRLDGLATPGHSRHAADGSCDAVDLFVERMQQVSGDHGLQDADGEAIARICDLVEGLPLAIEIAAAWTPVITCTEIAAEIERDLGFLTAGEGHAGDAQRRLDAVLRRAWDHLPAREQQVFCQLAVFRRGFRRQEAALVVDVGGDVRAGQASSSHAGLQPEANPRALDAALGVLVDRSLLRRTGGRYRQHPLVHQFAAQRLAEAPELKEAAEARHAAVYANLLAASAAALRSASQQEALAELDPEGANLQAAWRWAAGRRDLRLLGLCVDALDAYFDLHSWSQEAVQAFEDAVGGVHPVTEGERKTLGRVLARLGMHNYRLNRLSAAREVLDRCLETLGPAGAAGERALALHALGNIQFWQGEYGQAEGCYADGLVLAREAGDHWLAAALIGLLGDCASIAGNHTVAMAAYEESLLIYRRLGDPRMVSVAVSNLADGYRRQGCAAEARPLYHEGLEIAERIGHRRLVANDLNGLGELAYDQGDYREASRYYQASLEMCREIGSRLLANLDLAGLACTAGMQGDTARARGYLSEALQDLIGNQSWAVLPAILIGVAHISARLDDQGKGRAVGLLAQVLCHRITWDEYRIRATHLLDDLEATMSPAQFDRAFSDPTPLSEVVRQVLGLELPENALALAEAGCPQAEPAEA